MSLDPQIPSKIVRHFLNPLAIHTAQCFLGGGLSGARIWQCTSSSHGLLYLRQWPTPHPTEQRLSLMHACMRFARDRGLIFVPELHGDVGRSFCEANG